MLDTTFHKIRKLAIFSLFLLLTILMLVLTKQEGSIM